MTNTWAILFFRGFSFLLLLLEGSKLVSQATWRNEHNPIILTQAKIQSLTEKFSLERKKPAQWFWAGSLLVKLSTSKEAACFNCKRTYRLPSLHLKKSWIRTRLYLTHLKMVTVSTISRTHIPTGWFFYCSALKLTKWQPFEKSQNCSSPKTNKIEKVEELVGHF